MLLDEFVKQFKEAEDIEVEPNKGDDDAKDEDSKHFNFNKEERNIVDDD
jgi:hypothetical protein